MIRDVFYVDGGGDSTGVIKAALRQLDLKVRQFADVEQCLGCLGTQGCHLLISNAKRPAQEGLGLLAGARRIQPSVPVVLLVDHGDIQTAVCAMKCQAADCLERPPDRASLLSAIGSILANSGRDSPPPEPLLSDTEKTVLHLILRGNTTAETARILGRSKRTIEVHRGHIMEKLEARGVVDLVRTCFRIGLLEDWP
jgi:two-component system response regulator FixJ